MLKEKHLLLPTKMGEEILAFGHIEIQKKKKKKIHHHNIISFKRC